ncbi:MAG: methionine--tRNA ligase subunit beta, partial [Stenotrophomonas sp.]|nr:methionine--tRNA ligase subunit beta [Stenotrophomonas sp.]
SGGVDDLDLNLADFTARVNADLVGKFVNLASRASGFLMKYFNGILYPEDAIRPNNSLFIDRQIVSDASHLQVWYETGNYNFVLRNLMTAADQLNKYWSDEEPWNLAKNHLQHQRLHSVTSECLRAFYRMAVCLYPICPELSTKALRMFGLAGRLPTWSDIQNSPAQMQNFEELFTRIDPKMIDAMTDASKDTLTSPPAAEAKPAKAEKPAKVEAKTEPKADGDAPAYIGIDDFAKLDLRIGKVLECGFVEGSDKLLRFLLDAGDLGQRQIFSGIRGSYGEPETLVGRNVVFIANLAPRKMRFGLSEGMILSAGFDGGALALLDADAGAQPGMPVR